MATILTDMLTEKERKISGWGPVFLLFPVSSRGQTTQLEGFGMLYFYGEMHGGLGILRLPPCRAGTDSTLKPDNLHLSTHACTYYLLPFPSPIPSIGFCAPTPFPPTYRRIRLSTTVLDDAREDRRTCDTRPSFLSGVPAAPDFCAPFPMCMHAPLS